MKRLVIIPALHAVILIAEEIAFIHDIQAFGIGMFQYADLLTKVISNPKMEVLLTSLAKAVDAKG